MTSPAFARLRSLFHGALIIQEQEPGCQFVHESVGPCGKPVREGVDTSKDIGYTIMVSLWRSECRMRLDA